MEPASADSAGAVRHFTTRHFMLPPGSPETGGRLSCRDPEASENDKYVALQFLSNSEIAAKGVLPTCQDTGTAIIVGKKGQRVWTGGGDEAALARGVYNTYIEDNLRYSQNAALDMYKEVNTGTQPACADRPVRGRWRRVQIPLCRQRRRLCQQDVSLPGNQSPADARAN